MLTRLVQRARPLVAEYLAGVRDAFGRRTRSMQRTLQALYQQARHRREAAVEQRRHLYARLIGITEYTIRQACRVRQVLAQVGVAPGPRPSRPALSERLGAQLDHFLPLVEQIVHQARTRVLEGGEVAPQEKVVSLFELHTRVLQREKPGASVEFGRHLMFDEVEGRIVTRYQILSVGEGERHELEQAVAHHWGSSGVRWNAAGRGSNALALTHMLENAYQKHERGLRSSPEKLRPVQHAGRLAHPNWRTSGV